MSAPARVRTPRADPRGRRGSAAARGAHRGAVPAASLVAVVLVPLAVSFLLVLAVLAAVAATAGGSLPGDAGPLDVVGAVLPVWLAAHLVPVVLAGAPLSAGPLAPALLVGLLVAATVGRVLRRVADPRPTTAVGVVAAVTAAHAACGVLGAALLTPGTLVDASPVLAGLDCGLLAATAATLGAARPCGLFAGAARLPVWLRGGFRSGLLGAVLLLGAGAALVAASLLAHLTAVAAVFARVAPDAGGGAGLALLSLAYLPNAVVAATSWLAGPGLSVGVATTTPTVTVVGPASTSPPLPLAALLPQVAPPAWAGLAFALPLAVGTLLGWRIAPLATRASTRLQAVAVAAVTTAVPWGLLAALAGGRLGAGPFDPVSVPAGLVLLTVLAWIAVPGAIVVLLAAPAAPLPARSGRRTSAPAAAGRSRSRGGTTDTHTAPGPG